VGDGDSTLVTIGDVDEHLASGRNSFSR